MIYRYGRHVMTEPIRSRSRRDKRRDPKQTEYESPLTTTIRDAHRVSRTEANIGWWNVGKGRFLCSRSTPKGRRRRDGTQRTRQRDEGPRRRKRVQAIVRRRQSTNYRGGEGREGVVVRDGRERA